MAANIEVSPLTAAIGAEVSGVDLRQTLSDDVVAAVRAALLAHLVVFFRDQPLSDEQHLSFALRFGPLSVPPLATRYQERPTVTVLDPRVSRRGARESVSAPKRSAATATGSIT